LLSDGIYEYCNAATEEFGEQRVADILRTHHRKSAAELSAVLLEAVRAFAAGAPQEDDITVVLVRRAAAGETVQRAFRRNVESLQDIFAFTAAEFARQELPPQLLQTVDFTVEELFTNMVKYSKMSEAAVEIALVALADGVEVTLTDHDVEAFDVTQAPDVDVDLPIEQRQPGGLGLHLVRRMVDSMEYQYSEKQRQSRIGFCKTLQSGVDATRK
jgi:anti-sigma regulatory factor (Ser/Thr protein kinase)